jgi:hypothetical protein
MHWTDEYGRSIRWRRLPLSRRQNVQLVQLRRMLMRHARHSRRSLGQMPLGIGPKFRRTAATAKVKSASGMLDDIRRFLRIDRHSANRIDGRGHV